VAWPVWVDALDALDSLDCEVTEAVWLVADFAGADWSGLAVADGTKYNAASTEAAAAAT